MSESTPMEEGQEIGAGVSADVADERSYPDSEAHIEKLWRQQGGVPNDQTKPHNAAAQAPTTTNPIPSAQMLEIVTDEARTGEVSAPAACSSALAGLIDAIVAALYESRNVMIIGDGCCSEGRDKMIMRRIIEPVARQCLMNAPESSRTLNQGGQNND